MTRAVWRPSSVLQWCRGVSVVFMAAGREDMLGKGRPSLLLLQVSQPSTHTSKATGRQ